MQKSFYEFISKFVNPDSKDPMSRLANRIKQDIAFPKSSSDFNEISSYLESISDYSKLLVVFDDAWQLYQTTI